MEKRAFVGAGGHGKVVFEAYSSKDHSSHSLFVVDEANIESSFWDQFDDRIKLIPHVDLASWSYGNFHLAIGDNKTREALFSKISSQRAEAFSVIHPEAIISNSSSISAGCFVAASSVIAHSCIIGKGCIVNHNSTIDHDCSIGAFSHVAPGAVLCGGVIVGKNVLIGAGAVVVPGVSIGDDCVVGAGAVVVKDLGCGEIVTGVPAK